MSFWSAHYRNIWSVSKPLSLLFYTVLKNGRSKNSDITICNLVRSIRKQDVKLYCTHVNYRNLLWYFIFLYAPITLDGYHAWFHLYGLREAVRNGKQAKNSNWKYVSPAGFEPETYASQAGALDHSDTVTGDELCLKVLHIHGIWIKSTRDNTCINWLCLDVF